MSSTMQSGPPSRRTIVRGGAALAWSVPVVLAASAAPAHAASGDTTLQVVVSQPVRVPPLVGTRLEITSTVMNTGAFDTTALTVVLRVSASIPRELGPSTASDVMGFMTPTRSGSGQTVFFTYVAVSQLEPGLSIVFNPTVTLAVPTDGAINVRATPGNGQPDDMSFPFQ